MIYLNKEMLHDKVRACWVGKNIGGTLGTPYEGQREMHHITGFATKPGEVLGNDDLDLQLIWLMAVEERGPENINTETLGEYWLSFVDPYWNEYGVGKCNMKEGFFPPLSGEINNGDWRNSNGAWIRTEIWACLYPGRPDKACRYAFEDACVDHGFGEGTFAAIFIAAMESAAFVVSDIQTLLKIGLSKIPEDCRVAGTVRTAMQAYEKGVSWEEARQAVFDDAIDVGWFQAPLNIGFVTVALLYGEGDFKKSLLMAVNCGDDTDCTAATLGSLLGIMYGQAGIPDDWRAYIGDNIITMSLNQGHNRYPQTCTELADIVCRLLPATNRVPYVWNRFENYQIKTTDFVTITDGETDISEIRIEDYMGRDFVEKQLTHSRYSFRRSNLMAEVWVEYDGIPRIDKNGTLSGKVTIELKQYPEIPAQRHFHLRWFLPEGWTVSGESNLFVCHPGWGADYAPGTFLITANENVEALNKIVLEISTVGRLAPIYMPVNIMG